MLRSTALRLGRQVYHGHEVILNGARTSSGLEANHVRSWAHMASTGNSGASRIGLHIFDQNTRSSKSSPPDQGDKEDNSDASKGMRWRIVESRDLKTMNKADGKIVDDKAAIFLPEHVAPEWPPMLVESQSSGEEEFSRPAPGINARVVLGSFRASAEMYLSEWRNVVQDTFGDQENVELVELAVCDVGVMRMWPFKGFMMRASRAKGDKRMLKMPVRHVHHFGDLSTVTEGLHMNNRLTGYVFVVDDRGRIRWRSTGKLTEAESHSMMQAVRVLAPDQNKEIDP